jgi:glycyl-tRNA synthetase
MTKNLHAGGKVSAVKNLYNRNGLVFWDDEQIKLRRMFEDYFVLNLTRTLKEQNRAFEVVQTEAPLLTPNESINPNYTDEDIYRVSDGLTLRPETTMGSYVAAVDLLSTFNARKVKLPLVVWQHGKSFRREQDQPSKHMRLKEFYQLEFQILYSRDTANDYSKAVVPAVRDMIASLLGPCLVAPSDRIPSYAEWTQDVICAKSEMEVCSISRRHDFEQAAVLEVAIGTDRCVYNFQRKNEP